MKISITHNCRLCDHNLEDPFLRFENIPVAGIYLTSEELGHDTYASLSVHRCSSCELIQLSEVVPNSIYKRYMFAGGFSNTYRSHLKEIIKIIRKLNLPSGVGIVEAGSNDRTLLKLIGEYGYKAIGFEPSFSFKGNNLTENVNIIEDYFTEETVDKYGIKNVSVFLARHVLEHIQDLKAFLLTIRKILILGGFIIIEVPDALSIFRSNLVSNIFHEHLTYFNLCTLIKLFSQYGFNHVQSTWSPAHGGSIVSVYKNGPFDSSEEVDVRLVGDLSQNDCLDYAKKAQQYLNSFRERLCRLASRGMLCGYGAAQRTTALLGMAGIPKGMVEFIVDQNKILNNLYLPGIHIPIMPPSELIKIMPDFTFIFARSHEAEIVADTQEYLSKGGHLVSIKNESFGII